jgi:integrase/recombinase XerC
MPKTPSLHRTARAWLLDGPLAAVVPAYIARLKCGHYACGTVNRSLAALAHFAHWMSLCRLRADQLDESRVDQFLHDHLRQRHATPCRSRGTARRHYRLRR